MLELSSILSAVKPKERTDQYKILAAMYGLNAHVVPVKARTISDALSLQLGKKNVPKNIPDRLRKYSAYIDPADKGPPIKWRLTQKGLDQLRSLSGLALSSPASTSDFKTDIGFVCALEHPELQALLKAFGGATKWRDVGDSRYPHVYRESQLQLPGNGQLNVIATTTTSMGLTAAAIATTHLILQFQPRIVIMVGIAAGTRGGGRQFGDILFADPSVDYNSGKVAGSGGIREFLPDPYPIGLNARLRSLLHKYRGQHDAFSKIRSRWSGACPTSPNRLHVGPLVLRIRLLTTRPVCLRYSEIGGSQ